MCCSDWPRRMASRIMVRTKRNQPQPLRMWSLRAHGSSNLSWAPWPTCARGSSWTPRRGTTWSAFPARTLTQLSTMAWRPSRSHMVWGKVKDTRVASVKEMTCSPSWDTSRFRKSSRHLGASSGAASSSKWSEPSWIDPPWVGLGRRDATGWAEISLSNFSWEKRIAGRFGVNSAGT